jgi:hypothetical protein
MKHDQEPVVLELAPLPREQIGPFFLLGLDKDAGPSEIETHWAQRIVWARKKQLLVALGDINWAREVINDSTRRLRADITSLNVDTVAGVLRKLAEQYGAGSLGRPGWRPLPVEKELSDYTPPTEVPDMEQVRATLEVPAIPREVPVVAQLLAQFAGQPLDPWDA